MTPPRDPHDGWTPEVQQEEQPPLFDPLTALDDAIDAAIEGWMTDSTIDPEKVIAGLRERGYALVPARQDEPGLRTALLKLNRTYIGGKVTLDADAFDDLVLGRSEPVGPAAGEPPEPQLDKLMALLGPSHPHDEGRECGACAAYNLLAAARGEPGLDVERLASGIAYAMVRTALPGSDETSRDYANRLAPLVIESGYLATPTTPEPDQ